MLKIIQKQEELISKRESFVTMTLVNIIGSAPQDLGAKAIVTSEGLNLGTIGGGKIEAHAIKFAQNLIQDLKQDSIRLMKWNLQTDIGMTCGGVVEVLFERIDFANQFKVAVFGAGHVAIETVELLSKLNCYIVNVESRKEWQDKIPNKPNIMKVLTSDMSKVITELDDSYFVVSLTMGHAFDLPILAAALKRNFKFIGVIGSEQKANTLKKELLDHGISSEVLSRLICPVGLSIGSNDPAEIAISIVSQLIQYRDN